MRRSRFSRHSQALVRRRRGSAVLRAPAVPRRLTAPASLLVSARRLLPSGETQVMASRPGCLQALLPWWVAWSWASAPGCGSTSSLYPSDGAPPGIGISLSERCRMPEWRRRHCCPWSHTRRRVHPPLRWHCRCRTPLPGRRSLRACPTMSLRPWERAWLSLSRRSPRAEQEAMNTTASACVPRSQPPARRRRVSRRESRLLPLPTVLTRSLGTVRGILTAVLGEFLTVARDGGAVPGLRIGSASRVWRVLLLMALALVLSCEGARTDCEQFS